MSDEELIARLRENQRYEWHDPIWETRLAAADRIEALTEQLAAARQDAKEAEAYAEELEAKLNTCRMAQAVMDYTVADLEAKLAKAVEALEKAATEMDDYVGRGYGDCFRETLAEIKGESHE